jgi:hypothetical protein
MKNNHKVVEYGNNHIQSANWRIDAIGLFFKSIHIHTLRVCCHRKFPFCNKNIVQKSLKGFNMNGPTDRNHEKQPQSG